MARKRKGRDVSGWLVVDKPEGVTSTQVVGRVRWAFDASKAGHAGTLDPLATGLLAVALGEATKTVPHAQDGRKTYQFTARWGASTTTDDREGDIVETSGRRPTAAEIEAALPDFVGEIMQTPPIYSAIKVDGKRAYDLARTGSEVTLAARPIDIHALRLISTTSDEATFEMTCGKGGYVRSMARDIGAALGVPAHVSRLRRLSSGAFNVDAAIAYDDVEALKENPARDQRLMRLEAALTSLPKLDVTPEIARRIRQGAKEAAPASPSADWLMTSGGRPVALMRRGEDGRTEIARVFVEERLFV